VAVIVDQRGLPLPGLDLGLAASAGLSIQDLKEVPAADVEG
jgi:hypothetical protein